MAKKIIEKKEPETIVENNTTEIKETNTVENNVVKELTFQDLFKELLSGYGENGNETGKQNCHKIIASYLKQEASKVKCFKKYNIIVLYDDTTLVKGDADNIYNAVTRFTEKKPLLLVLYSRGGSAASAYLIGKLCREYSNETFVASIPRFAKSAATLITCAANEIHMGSLSELGPIDPQINDLPALGLKNSIEHIAELVKTYPESSDMFSKYLQNNLTLINLGYYERVAESAAQYAEKLLDTHSDNLPRRAKEIAHELVYKYKDHGFVIDRAEAINIFGEQIIKSNTDEYELGNVIYKSLDMIGTLLGYLKHNFHFIGSLDSQASITKRK
jgi:hypothetical protein